MAKYRKRNISYSNQRQSRAQSGGPIEIDSKEPIVDPGVHTCCGAEDLQCLLDAMRNTESSGQCEEGTPIVNKCDDKGCTPPCPERCWSCGPYQIKKKYWGDAQQQCHPERAPECCELNNTDWSSLCDGTMSCAEQKRLSELAIMCWLRRYTRNGGCQCTGNCTCTNGPNTSCPNTCFSCEDLARIHNGGPCGHNSDGTDEYIDGVNKICHHLCNAGEECASLKAAMCQCGDGEVIGKEEKSMDIPDDAVGSCCFFDSSDQSICKDGMCYGQCKELKGCWNEDLCEDRIMNGESLCCNDCRGRSKCTLGSTTKKKLIKIIKDGNNKTKFRSRVDGGLMSSYHGPFSGVGSCCCGGYCYDNKTWDDCSRQCIRNPKEQCWNKGSACGDGTVSCPPPNDRAGCANKDNNCCVCDEDNRCECIVAAGTGEVERRRTCAGLGGNWMGHAGCGPGWCDDTIGDERRSRVIGDVITPDIDKPDGIEIGACCNSWKKGRDGTVTYSKCSNISRTKCNERWGTFNAGTRCIFMDTPCPETASYGGCCVPLADGTYGCMGPVEEDQCNGVWMGEGSTCMADEGENSCAEVHKQP